MSKRYFNLFQMYSISVCKCMHFPGFTYEIKPRSMAESFQDYS